MKARIYQPARNAMQSGVAKTKQWVLEYAPSSSREVDPLMGWTSSNDTQSQVRLKFDSKEAAIDYAEDNGIDHPWIRRLRREVRYRLFKYDVRHAVTRVLPSVNLIDRDACPPLWLIQRNARQAAKQPRESCWND